MPGLSDFYTGSMAAPDKGPNGTLVQSHRYAAPASIPDLYGGAYSEIGQPPTKRVVQTTPVAPSYADKNRNDIIEAKPAPVFAANNAPSTVNAATPLDANRMGFTVDFSNPAVKAIATATKPSGFDPVGPGLQLGYGSLLDMLYDPAYSGSYGKTVDPGTLVAGPGSFTDDPWGPSTRTGPAGRGTPGLVTGTPAARGEPVQPVQPSASPIAEMFGGFGGHDTSSPEAFAASVTRQSTMPGVPAFTGTVQQGQAGQNRYGSTARNELLALYG